MRILVVEDDAVLRGVMQRSLADAGHRVDVAATLAEADHFWKVQPFDAVLLDLNLPQCATPGSAVGSGLDVLRAARKRGDRTPVLVLTARDRTEERIAGLDAGADDYLGKPFDLNEVEARLRARAQDSDEVIAGRMERSRDEISHWAEYDYVIINRDIDSAFNELTAILQAERLKRDRQPDLSDFVRNLNREFETR